MTKNHVPDALQL